MKWPILPLTKLCRIETGRTPSRAHPEYFGGDNIWVTIADLNGGTISESKEHVTDNAVAKARMRPVPAGTVLLSYKLSLGKLGIAGRSLYTNEAIAALPPRLGVDLVAKYLFYALRTVDYLALCHGAVKGKCLNRASLSRIPVPLPPLSEQRRIVEILDQADALRKKRTEADAKAARILPALFCKIFGNPATNPKGLDKKRLGDLIKVRSGNFLPAKNMDTEGQYPVYGGNGINGYHSEYMFEQPVIVLGRVGAYCGAIYYSEPNCWVTDNALYVAEQSDDLHPRYLTEALRVANLNQYAGRAGQPLISWSRIYPVEILVPPPEDQETFARSIVNLHRDEKRRRDADDHIEKLFSVLLHRAFTCDLTAQWREAHMQELLQEMDQQAKALSLES